MNKEQLTQGVKKFLNTQNIHAQKVTYDRLAFCGTTQIHKLTVDDGFVLVDSLAMTFFRDSESDAHSTFDKEWTAFMNKEHNQQPQEENC